MADQDLADVEYDEIDFDAAVAPYREELASLELRHARLRARMLSSPAGLELAPGLGPVAGAPAPVDREGMQSELDEINAGREELGRIIAKLEADAAENGGREGES
jgi:hypothetical protein